MIQDEIREGLARLMSEDLVVKVGGAVDEGDYISALQMSRLKRADKLMSYLHSKGVVIKKTCPSCNWWQWAGKNEAVGMTTCCQCNCTGSVEEPLIKEG